MKYPVILKWDGPKSYDRDTIVLFLNEDEGVCITCPTIGTGVVSDSWVGTHDECWTPLGTKNLAFYKRSELPWTVDEFNTIMEFVGESPLYGDMLTATDAEYKYIFDRGSEGSENYFPWDEEIAEGAIANCTELCYEDFFGVLERYPLAPASNTIYINCTVDSVQFLDTPQPIKQVEELSFTRPDLHDLLRVGKHTLSILMDKLSWVESLEYQLARFKTIRKELAEELHSSNPKYNYLLQLIKYYDGAIRDAEHNLSAKD